MNKWLLKTHMCVIVALSGRLRLLSFVLPVSPCRPEEESPTSGAGDGQWAAGQAALHGRLL